MTPLFVSRLRRVVTASRTAALTFAATLTLLCAASAPAQTAPRSTLITSTPASLVSAADSGPSPSSQRLSLTLTLAQDPARAAALQQFLSDVTTPTSASYHKFLTPTQFAAAYGASADQLAAATAWATAQGFSVDSVSPAGTRLTVSAAASVIQTAFAVTLHTYQISGSLYFANATQPSLPTSAAPLFSAIDGLSNLPSATLTANAAPATFASLASAIDANTTSILTIDSSLSSTSLTDSQLTAWTTLFRQASAQGITLLASRPSIAAAFPASLPEVTAVALPGATADATLPALPRPTWQAAPGLPADTLRYAPDLTASSLAALAQTLSAIETSSSRQGNINAILYELGPTPSLYTQPDSAAAGTWEQATGLGLIDLDTLLKVFPRGTTQVEVDTTASNYSPVHGAGFTLTSTVYPGAAGTPTGTITWSSPTAGFPSTTVNLNASGVAISPTFQLPGGSFTITSAYSGDGTFTTGSTTTTVFVSAEPANFTLSVPATAALGVTLAVTATVASPSGIGIPSGTITAGVTGSTSQTMYLNGSGSSSTAAFSFNVNQAGALAVQATCASGDGSFTCYSTQNATVNVAKATPTVSLSLSTLTPTNGTPVTFTIGVTGLGSVTPTGTVAIKDNGNTITTITLPATTGQATLGAGASHSVTAVYSGDTNYNTVTSAAMIATTGLAATTTTAVPFPASSSYGQPPTLVITVAPTSGNQVNGNAPSGTVTVTSGTVTATSQNLGNGTVNITLPVLPVGTDAVTVSYPGDTNYSPSTVTINVTVTPFAATIAPQLSYNMFTQGSSQTLTVQFASTINAPVPQNAAFTATLNGTVYPGKFNINGGGVNATGQVTIYAPAPAGTYQLQVACVANVDFSCNTPAAITVTSTATTFMGPPPTGGGTGTSPTTTTLTSSSNAPAAGASVTLTATVASSAGNTTAPTGTVSFYDGNTLLTTSPLALAGTVYTASATVTLPGSGAQSLTAVYSGDTVFASSTSPALSVTTNASAAAITLTASSTTGEAGQSVTFTARVTGSTFSGVVPTGSVTFYLGGSTPAALATIGLGYSGPGVATASYTTTGIPAGAQTIYAVYSGDGNFSAVTSNTISLGLSDFSVAFSPSVITLTSGQTGTSTATVTLKGSASNTITFACTPPANTDIGCSFSPSTLSAGGATTLTVTTVAHKAQPGQSAALSPSSRAAEALAGVSFAALFCLMLPGRTRRRLPSLLLVLLACFLAANLGCGSSNLTSPISGTTGTPLGTSILSITTAATDGTNTIRHTYSVQVTVQ